MDVKSDDRQQLAVQYGMRIVTDLMEFPLIKQRKKVLSYSFVKQRHILPLEETEDSLLVALANPSDLEAKEEVRMMTGKIVRELFASQSIIEEAIEACYHHDESETTSYVEKLKRSAKKTEDEIEGYDLLENQSSSPVIRLLNVILIEAVQQGSSDIHFDPLENGLSVRYRIDGVLQQRHSPPKEFQSQLLTRIKVIAKLDIAEYRRPQDGRIKLSLGGRQIDFRVSTVPVAYGERIVLRILDRGNVVLGLEKIGMNPELLKQFRSHIRQNQGIILVTGPTGSGKTTTLYSALSELSSSELNLMTIEDPVEYKLQGMAQINVNPKIDLDFATGLRHILRQDPDVVMIGEIRDREPAEIAIQASLTGHLVLSTLHTNDAPSALTRLVDMGIEPYLLTSSVLAVLAQRLIRKICLHCSESYVPEDEELMEVGIARESLLKGILFRGVGCAHCFHSGYKGRHGIYELMSITNPIKRQLLKSPDATDIQKIALEEGMISLRSEGSRLATLGITTSSEVLRVTRNTLG